MLAYHKMRLEMLSRPVLIRFLAKSQKPSKKLVINVGGCARSPQPRALIVMGAVYGTASEKPGPNLKGCTEVSPT